MTVSAVNDAPVTVGELSSTDEDTGLVFTQAQLLANDSDVDTATDGQVLTITAVSGATHGTVSMLASGNIQFIPTTNYHGPASFTYTVSDGNGGTTNASVSITINAVNDTPVVLGETVSTSEDTTLWFYPADLLTNDTDVDIATDGQVLSISAVGNATHGSVAFVTLADGSRRIAFTPDANYSGSASFEYAVSDGVGGVAVATMVVNLSAVNDAPDAVADSVSATEDTLLTVTSTSLLDNDSDVDNLHSALRIVGVSNATHGSVSLSADGSISFSPDLNYFGLATFNYTVSDGVGGFSVGIATVNIAPVNDSPVAVGEIYSGNEDVVATFSVASLLDNDSDVDNAHSQLSILSVGGATHGSVSLVTTNGNTNVVFTPDLNFYGTASFTYTISDGVGGTATASMSLNFTSVNDAPVVNNELYAGKRNVSYSLLASALLTNDTDVETPSNLTLASVGNAQHGSVSLVNGNILFVPVSGYSGRGSFDYVVRDADGGQTTGTTQIDFSYVNANPTAVDDSFSGTEDTSLSITTAQLLANDSDTDNASSSLSVASLGSATHGTVAFDSLGNVLFTPDSNFNGQASFSYLVVDPDGGSTWATAHLSIASVNDAPIIEDIWYGRPVYGYQAVQQTVNDSEGSYTYTAYSTVDSLTKANAILASGGQLYKPQKELYSDSEGNVNSILKYYAYSPTYYLNGSMRPISFNTNDATLDSTEENSSQYLGDDLQRQNGAVVAYDPDGDSSALTFTLSSSPQHGHAWVNQYTNSNASGGLDYTQAGPYSVSDKGAWQYYSSKGDTYSGSDSFTVQVTDAGGASVNATVETNHSSWPVSGGGGGGGCPVVVDLDGDGVELISADESQIFDDVNGDGWQERMGWVSSDDGFLALDRNGDGVIDGMKDISFSHDLPGAHTDLDGLRSHDTNGDGLISCNDTEWAKFGIWQDVNSNGIQDAGEFHSLKDLGVASITLNSDNNLRLDQGNVVFGETQVNLTSGKSLVAVDVMLAGQGVPYPAQVQEALLEQQAEIVRKALLFNQVCSAAVAESEDRLGFVDTNDASWQYLSDHGADGLSDSRVAC
ncbi:tandem-95 repeat protein [Limnohabitans sp.]|uniref:tandem-95 repeat protein n=1 Tax=Limnohabitans sp. TaxID=1907725 RepID=UPI0038BC934F